MAGVIIGEKLQQTQQFSEKEDMIPVTVINTSPCNLVAVFTKEKDGYNAIKLGFGKAKRTDKPTQGQLKKAGIKAPLSFLKEIRITPNESLQFIEEDKKQGVQFGEKKVFIGEEINPSEIFKTGEKIDVSGISKGKGFQGVVRRHNFGGGPKTHGQSDRHRAPGSIGSSATPGRVFKGTRMAGQMGKTRITVKNLEVISADEKSITIKGLIPGPVGNKIEIRTVGINKK